jgi:hypothetical protein
MSIPYILGKLSVPLFFGLIVYLYFRLSKKRRLTGKEKKVVIIVIIAGYVLMLLSAISRTDFDAY